MTRGPLSKSGLSVPDEPTYHPKQYAQAIREIGHMGWTVVTVDEPGSPRGLIRAYTMGMSEYGNEPELLAYGIVRRKLAAVLQELGNRFVRFEGGGVPQDMLIEGLRDDPPLIAKRVPARVAKQVAPWAAIRAREVGTSLSLLQLVWPDNRDRYPWDPHYDRIHGRSGPWLYQRGKIP